MRICYLASVVTLPGSPERRVDAFEHDYMMASLRKGASPHGATVEDVSWDADVDWSQFDAVLIGTTWDYWDRYDAFLATLAHIERQTPLFNSAPLVQWNSHKRYLAELAEHGVPTIPTEWRNSVDPGEFDRLSEALGSDDLVFKRQVGAGADGQHRIRRGEPLPDLPHPMLIQPFLPAIQEEGELSFILVDGELSHGLLKRPAQGDYRIQSSYGGREVPIQPSREDVAAATAVLDAIEAQPLYARVDMIRHQGALRLMELELIEPYLYPEQGPHIGERLVAAIRRRLSAASA